MYRLKNVLETIGVVLFFAIPVGLIVLFTLMFERYFNSLQFVQHMMY